MFIDPIDHKDLFRAYDGDRAAIQHCPCCGNTERLLREQIRCVGAIVSTPFHHSIMPLIEPNLSQIKLRGGELFSISPQLRQTLDFADAVRNFEAAVEAYCAVLRTIDGVKEGGSNIPQSDLQRAFALRRALISIVRYADVLAEEASPVGEEP